MSQNECIISELLCLQNHESAIDLQREEQLRIEGGIQVSKICRIQGTEKSKMGSRADLGTAPQIKDMLKRGERATTKKQVGSKIAVVQSTVCLTHIRVGLQSDLGEHLVRFRLGLHKHNRDETERELI